jgi:Amt family ammonium transporter
VKKRLMTVAVATGALSVLGATAAFAQDGVTPDDLAANLTVVFVGVAAALVFLMQAGFTLVEVGLTRGKNAGNITMKNMTDMMVGCLSYWAIGAAFAYGSGAFIGTTGFFDPAGVLGDGTQWVFQMVFAATAATIVSGAVAERMKFSGYVLTTIAITALIYPIVTHWQWTFNPDDSWLFALGYHDFAGSSLVHMTGGVAALMGAAILGPRIGKYGKDGKPRAIPGHNTPLAIVGVFILWFGWYGFNGGSQLSAGAPGDAAAISVILLSTSIAAAAGGVAAMAITWIRQGKPDVGMTGNGILAGLVGITAGTNFATSAEAFVIGLLSGAIVVFAVSFFDRVKVDDPVGAISVHGVAGAFGTLAVGVIAAGESNGGGGEISLATQAIGVVSIAAFVAIASGLVFLAIRATIGLRVSTEEEIEGLDVHEHGVPGYAPDVLAGAGAPKGPAYGFEAPGSVSPTARPAGE